MDVALGSTEPQEQESLCKWLQSSTALVPGGGPASCLLQAQLEPLCPWCPWGQAMQAGSSCWDKAQEPLTASPAAGLTCSAAVPAKGSVIGVCSESRRLCSCCSCCCCLGLPALRACAQGARTVPAAELNTFDSIYYLKIMQLGRVLAIFYA